MIASHADLRARLAALARIVGAPSSVVSVYLRTRWADEQQRERVRVFLNAELKKARLASASPQLAADLAWVAEQGERIIGQARHSDARGIALFACDALGLREVLPLRVPVEDLFVVAEAPYVRRLAELLDDTPATLVVFVDAGHARLIQLRPDGIGQEVTLQNEIHGHHRQGGWHLLAQSRYQRHIQAQQGRHFDAVAAAITELVDEQATERIVLAGEPRAVAVFQKHLEGRIGRLVVGSVKGTRVEPAGTLVERARALLELHEGTAEATDVDRILTEAAKDGHATAGVAVTLAAASRGAVRRLYLLKTFSEPGRQCTSCGALEPGTGATCHACGSATKEVELGEALVERVLTTGGTVESVDGRASLARAGGVAALLRYPL